MTKFAKERKDAAKEIKANGYALTISKRGGSTTDPQTLKVTSTPINIETFGLNVAYSVRDIDGTNVKQGDIRVMTSALDKTGAVIAKPTSGDVFKITGQKDRSIVSVEQEGPDGEAIFYWLQVRG